MKRRRIGLVQNCLIAMFVVTALLMLGIHFHNYIVRKKHYLYTKTIEIKFAVNIIRNRVNNINNDINAIANELTTVFNLYYPSPEYIDTLIRSFGCNAFVYGMGYAELPGENAYARYIFHENGEFHCVNIRDRFPDYCIHSWFASPERTRKAFTETPTINRVGGKEGYMITHSFPHLDNNGKFKGVFVFDLFLEGLTADLDTFINDGNIDVSMFFPEKGGSRIIKFIKNTDIKVLAKQKLLLKFINLINKNNGIFHFDELVGGSRIVGTAISVFDNKAYIMVTFDKRALMEGVRGIFYKGLSLGLFVLVVLFISFYLILKYSFKPIEKISQNVKRISKGEFDADISVKSGAIEVIRLNDAIHKMQIQLKHYVKKMKKTAELDTEFKIAADIQKSVIPKSISKIKGYPKIDMCLKLRPAKLASGDFYDYFMLDDKNLFLSIGDVTGKGVPAALFTVMMVSIEKMYSEIPISISETLKMVNRKIIPMNELNIFISYFCMVINLETGKAKYANAGHDSPFITKNDGKTFQLKQTKGTFLGIFENVEFSEKYYQFEPGDVMFACTDGVTEAMNKNRKLFGKEGIIQVLSAGYNKTSNAIIKDVSLAINKFVDGASQSDDICMICFKLNK
jgi:phosphoserine phosphatase RsbU/P